MRIPSASCLAVMLFIYAVPASAVGLKDGFNSAAGTVQIVTGDGLDDVLLVNHARLKTESGAVIPEGTLSFQSVLPSREDAKYAVVAYQSGGNACALWGLYVLALNGRPWLSDDLGVCHVGNIKAGIRAGALLVMATSYDDANEFGDPQPIVWKFEANKLRVQPRAGVPDFWTHEHEHPFQFLGAAAVRAPIIAVLGSKFRDVRERLAVASGMQTENYRYLVGEGCLAHSCGSDEAFIIVDAYSGNTWAFYIEDRKRIDVYGPRSKYVRVPSSPKLKDWLSRWNVELANDAYPVRLRSRGASRR